MRNLKRALSLLLSSTMVLGMVVMGGSAAGYQDVDASNTNQEAIEVLQAVGIMSGVDDKGNFNPDGSLTRNEMAVVMAHLLNLDYDYYRGVNTFSDVPEWAAPYVAACVAEGVTAGIGNGLYGGDQKITAAQAGLMVMKALGYFQNQEDFGGDWQVATIRQASYISLFDNVNSNAESALTRGQVAQLVLNGLKSDMVTFTGDKGIQIGDVTVGYKAEYTPKTNAAVKYNSINTGKTDIAGNNQYYIQLGEELYNGDLKLKGDVDVFGRPSRNWEYDGKKIGTYVNYDLLVKEYTTKVTGKDLYDLLGASTIKDYGLTVYIDGVSDKDVNSNIFTAADMNKNNDKGVGDTGNGVLTQVFVDTVNKNITISIVNTYLAIADEDYNEKKDETSLTVYGLEKKGDEYLKVTDSCSNTDDDSLNMKLVGEDFDVSKAAVEGDAFLVTISGGEIQTVAKAQVISDVEITAFKQNTSVTVDGTKYDYADTAEYNYEVLDNYTSTANGTNLKDTTYNVYLDAYGYAIAVDQVEVPNNYVFITGVDDSYSNLSTKNIKASAIFLDGTMKTIDITTSKGDGATMPDSATVNSWYTYTVDNSNVYTVKAVASAIDVNNGVKVAQHDDNTRGNGDSQNIDKKHIWLAGDGSDGYDKVYGNDDTIYLTASIKEIMTSGSTSAIIIDGVDSVTTGLQNANIDPWHAGGAELTTVEAEYTNPSATQSAGVYTLYKSNGYIIATVVVGEDATASKNLVYVTSSSVEQESYDKTADEWTWTRKVAMNGEEIQLKEVSDSLTYLGNMDQYNWYQVKYNSKGEVIGVLDFNTDADFPNVVVSGSEYVDDIANLDTAIDSEDTVLFTDSFTAQKMSMIGNVLFAITNDASHNGFYVSDDVKVVLTQTNKNKTTTTYETGAKALKNIVDTLNEKASAYDYDISAIIENGVATAVVVRDKTNTYERPEDPTNLSDIFVDLSDNTDVIVWTTRKTMTETEAADAIGAALKNAGWTIGTPKFTAGSPNTYVWEDATKGNVKTDFTFNATLNTKYNPDDIIMTVDGQTIGVNDDTTHTIATVTSGSGNTYVRYKAAGASDWTYVADNSTVNVATGMTLETGYYEVQVNGAKPTSSDLNMNNLIAQKDVAGNVLRYLAHEDTVIGKASGIQGTGMMVNSNTYLKYGVATVGDVAAKDGTSNNIANIKNVNCIKVTEVKYDGTSTEIAVAYNTKGSVTNNADGTKMKVNGVAENANSTTANNLTTDTIIETGWVDVTAVGVASADSSVISAVFKDESGNVINSSSLLRRGALIYATVTLANPNSIDANDTINLKSPTAVNLSNLVVTGDTATDAGSGVITMGSSATAASGSILAVYTVGSTSVNIEIDYTAV